ncbi:branched-chain amino acid ABC transporter permease [Kaustia mangrovi]|uniref:Branched-chain amino acid ABC transporter permease n=1 Tax=Kaustia mangrovi TaxID=2593653 RepID=A0A7S8C6Z1_9HYPH|nr:branched-chain amino acid ABC transporter permease [Kaustia mangrovi]QPC44555.1 branched-chain amino acid ABC transporter permease [Kaustia mangrovi]
MQFLQALVDGVLIGGVYGVISIGLSLVFGVMNIVNFAHAAFLMLGMFVAWFAWHYLGLDPLLGAFLSFAVIFVFGCGVQRTLIRPILKAPQVAQIFLTVGILIVLENAALLVFGADFRSVQTPYQTSAFDIGGIIVSKPYLYAFAMALLSGAAVWAFLERTPIGRAMRATSQDPMAATLMGIDTNLMHMTAFGIGVGLTAFGGAVILPYLTASPTVGAHYVVLMFTAVVLGGLGSVAGAVVGGVAVGIIQSLSTLVFPIQLQNLILFVVFILVLALRPEGIVKRRAA